VLDKVRILFLCVAIPALTLHGAHSPHLADARPVEHSPSLPTPCPRVVQLQDLPVYGSFPCRKRNCNNLTSSPFSTTLIFYHIVWLRHVLCHRIRQANRHRFWCWCLRLKVRERRCCVKHKQVLWRYGHDRVDGWVGWCFGTGGLDTLRLHNA
jgi:hypothetical protein